jgi:hypothetical protein
VRRTFEVRRTCVYAGPTSKSRRWWVRVAFSQEPVADSIVLWLNKGGFLGYGFLSKKIFFGKVMRNKSMNGEFRFMILASELA